MSRHASSGLINTLTMLDRTGAPIAKVIHHGSRVSTSSYSANSIKKDDIKVVTKPGPAVFGAHLDQSSWQGYNVIHKYYPDECETMLQGRVIIVNVSQLVRHVLQRKQDTDRAFHSLPGMAANQTGIQAPIRRC